MDEKSMTRAVRNGVLGASALILAGWVAGMLAQALLQAVIG